MEQKLSKEQFLSALSRIDEATSVSGSHYSDIRLMNGVITGLRDSTGVPFMIKTDELYRAYCECPIINTDTLKRHLSGRNRPPALAIMIAAGMADATGGPKTKRAGGDGMDVFSLALDLCGILVVFLAIYIMSAQ